MTTSQEQFGVGNGVAYKPPVHHRTDEGTDNAPTSLSDATYRLRECQCCGQPYRPDPCAPSEHVCTPCGLMEGF